MNTKTFWPLQLGRVFLSIAVLVGSPVRDKVVTELRAHVSFCKGLPDMEAISSISAISSKIWIRSHLLWLESLHVPVKIHPFTYPLILQIFISVPTKCKAFSSP